MEFTELVKKRRSIHFFTEQAVSEEDIVYILDAARWAPSAGNSQPWRFIIVRKPENIIKVWETTTKIEYPISSKRTITITPQNFIKKAPVLIVVCTDTTAYYGKQSSIYSTRYCLQDSSNATMLLLLAAANRGLGACWVGMFRTTALSQALNLPPEIIPIAIVPIGHTTSKEKPPPRTPLKDLIHYEKYQTTKNKLKNSG